MDNKLEQRSYVNGRCQQELHLSSTPVLSEAAIHQLPFPDYHSLQSWLPLTHSQTSRMDIEKPNSEMRKGRFLCTPIQPAHNVTLHTKLTH